MNKLFLVFGILISSLFSHAAKADKPPAIYLNQGWTPEQRAHFYWGSQGSALLSYDIYLALQLPGSNEFFNSPANTDRVGLLMADPDLKNNPDNLPIGITKTVVPAGQFAGTYIGLTCAACHTSEVQYQGKKIRIDGGVAKYFDIETWMAVLADSLNTTLKDQTRFQNMLQNIQKTKTVDAADLKRRLELDAAQVNMKLKYGFNSPFPPGPGRMDALGSIHNEVVGIQTGILANTFPLSAPVKPPFLWNAPQSAWVQWSGVADNPLKRNYGETLGVFARYDLTSADPVHGLFDSTTDVKGLIALENLLKQLAPPQWPEATLGKLDQRKVNQGKRLFEENCVECHASFPYRWSTPREDGKRMIENSLVPVKIIGTDGEQFKTNSFDPKPTLQTGKFASMFEGKSMVSFGVMSSVLQNKIILKSLDQAGPFTDAQMQEMNGYVSFKRDGSDKTPENSYKAAPRDGVWATGPFLHNASVPTIYDLLTPADQRAKTFYVTREFDPIKLGLNTEVGTSADYLFDTTLIGNSNSGHSFEKGFMKTDKPGVIGRELSPKERYAIIEYLKSIPNVAGRVTPYGGPVKPVIAIQDKTWFNYKHPYNGLIKTTDVRSY